MMNELMCNREPYSMHNIVIAVNVTRKASDA